MYHWSWRVYVIGVLKSHTMSIVQQFKWILKLWKSQSCHLFAEHFGMWGAVFFHWRGILNTPSPKCINPVQGSRCLNQLFPAGTEAPPILWRMPLMPAQKSITKACRYQLWLLANDPTNKHIFEATLVHMLEFAHNFVHLWLYLMVTYSCVQN